MRTWCEVRNFAWQRESRKVENTERKSYVERIEDVCIPNPVQYFSAQSSPILIRCEAKFLTCEISDFTPCMHAQSNVHYTKYAEKTDY